MSFPSDGFARLAGKVGGQRRWSRRTPEQRKAEMAKVRAGQRQKYLDRAAAMAAERGLTPTPTQIEKAADALRDADLAAWRLKAVERAQRCEMNCAVCGRASQWLTVDRKGRVFCWLCLPKTRDTWLR